MRRIYLLVLAVVLVATLVGLAISEQAGYVLIAYKSFRYESSLWSFLALLAVVWLYYLMGSALRAPAAWLASAAFAVGALLELGQYLAAQLHWQFSSPVLRIVLGSTADGFDLLAYALGALLAWWLERRR
ncbi:DUF2809 domain-containing protein [Pseudomonas aeruginosa]|uniref:DUF2809 domain-containing protein n=1 Tax=Pseudomonas aeruginosa TaxID=287 RepID=UPI00069D13D9|nr:DUF2809 domain-containing protein [Pseudomonas aeruginosa]